MKILLKEDVDTLGYAGEVHEVAPGYGRNYLIPKGYAILATENNKKVVQEIKKQQEYKALGRMRKDVLRQLEVENKM